MKENARKNIEIGCMQDHLETVLKTAVGATPPWVQIPLLPPLTSGNIKTFYPGSTGVKGFDSGVKNEQNAPKIISTVPKNEYSLFSLRSRGAA